MPYTFVVTNTGNVTLTGITVTDPMCDAAPAFQSGDTNNDAMLQTTETWTYTCDHTVTQAEIDAGGNLSNTVTADSTESEPDTDSHEIPIVKPVPAQITPTNTSCTQFNSGTAATLSELQYSVKSGKVNQVNPGVFFYWVKVTAVAGSNTFTINQAITSSNNNFNHFFKQAAGSFAYTSNCVKVQNARISTSNGVTTVTFNASSAGTYIIGIKYNSKSVQGFSAPTPNTTVHYTFTLAGSPSSTQGLDLKKK